MNRPADIFTLLFDLSDKLRGDVQRDIQEYDILVETKVFIHSIIILMEKEVASMDVSSDQIETFFGEHILSDEQRDQVKHLFQAIEEAKQGSNQVESSTNPYQNRVPANTLQELSNRVFTLTEEQRHFVDYAEERIGNLL